MITQKKQMLEKISMFDADNFTLVNHVSKKNRNVLLVSNIHHTDNIDPSTGEDNESKMVTYYKTKAGGDMVDHTRKQYSAKRVCNR